MKEGVLVVVVVDDLSNVINDGCLTYSDDPMGNDERYRSDPNDEQKPKKWQREFLEREVSGWHAT